MISVTYRTQTKQHLLLPHPPRYFIKLVKRKYKKDVSTDSRALQARSLFAVFLFVPLACFCMAPGA